MKRDTLTRLIEAASPEQLRQIARLVLRLSGYPDSRITDGPYDGGADLRVQSSGGNSLPLAVALSIEGDWQKKLRDDADKVRRKLGLNRLLFMSSRRIPEGTFRTVQADVSDKLGVQVDRIDQQAVADLVMDNHKLSELLGILDIALDIGPQPSNPADRRRDAAYSYAFFSPDAQSFRAVVREQSLLVALAHAGGSAKLTDLYADTARLLGLPQEDVVRLLPDLERLLKQGRMRRFNGSVALGEAEKTTLDALRALREREETSLREQLASLLEQGGVHPGQDVLDITLRGLGALMLRHVGAPETLDDLRRQVLQLRRQLQAFGLPEGARGDQLLQRLVDIAGASPLGISLATGSLYRTLTNLHRDALLSAFDARSLSVVLDASVAIPMFCVRFHGTVKQRFFLVADELYTLARRQNIPLELPSVWLEEMASHLLKARDYRALVGTGTDELRLSQNAYVSYYATARAKRDIGSIDEFLATFGLTETLVQRSRGDYHAVRRQLEALLRQQLSRYGISIIETPFKAPHVKQADRDWDWVRHELNIEPRDPVLERHDKQVLAWLAGKVEDDPTHAPLIVTWDRLLRRARPEGTPGGALDPLAVCELLSFVGGDESPSETTRFVGFWLTELETERGAQILDTLVQLEKEQLSDAQLAQRAREFRTQYLAGRPDLSDVTALEKAWHSFRGRRR